MMGGRAVTRKINNLNVAARSNSGFKGVYFRSDSRRNPWHASITIDSKTLSLGNYQTPELAHEVYVEAARELQGYDVSTNTVLPGTVDQIIQERLKRNRSKKRERDA